MQGRLYSYCFLVNKRPYCIYDWRLPDESREFLRSIDSEYFAYIARVHSPQLNGPDKYRAATALRTTYHHAIETLLTLSLAALQAPLAVHAWILKSKTDDLRDLVEEIGKGEGQVFNQLSIDRVSWLAFAKIMYQGAEANDEERESASTGYARFLRRVSDDFLSELHQTEYNGVKHGFRCKPGGFTLSFGEPDKSGGPPPPDQMRVLGGGEHGSSFYVPSPPTSSPYGKKDPVFWMERHSITWNPHSIADGLLVLAAAIGNTVSFLRAHNQDQSEELTLATSENHDELLKAWANPTSVPNLKMRLPVHEKQVTSEDREGLLEKLRQAGNCRNVPTVPKPTITQSG